MQYPAFGIPHPSIAEGLSEVDATIELKKLKTLNPKLETLFGLPSQPEIKSGHKNQ